MLIAVVNFPNGKTVEYRITSSAGDTVQAWTSAGVTELVVSTTGNTSTYYVNSGAVTSGVQLIIDWRTSDETYFATDVINTMRSYVDASASAIKTQTDKLTFDASNYLKVKSVFPGGAVVSDAGNTAQVFKTDLVAGVDGYYKDSLLLFTSGALIDQHKKIIQYAQSTAIISLLSSFTGTPSNGDTFDIVNY